MTCATPFDSMAADYDRSFTASVIGQHLRAATWRWLDKAFEPGTRVLELNCGTGEDALHLAQRGISVLATDKSPAMIEATQAKIDRAGMANHVDVAQLAIEDLARGSALPQAGFDGVLSNFGGLNCVEDLPGLARGLAALMRPGAYALFCVMGPAVPWEWAWFLGQGKPRTAFRRLRRGGVDWRGMTIRYPTIGSVRRAFAPWFAQTGLCAIGALIPPTYVEPWAAKRPALMARLDRWERSIETLPPLPWLADHFLIRLERR